MRAVVMTGYGGPEVMELRDMPMPELGVKDVLVEVHAAALNPVDWKLRQGMLRMAVKLDFPKVMCSDFSGVVVETGKDVTSVKKGDAVFGMSFVPRLGALADYAAVDEDCLTLKPSALSHAEAASIPLVGLTAWQAIVERMALKRNQQILIHAGSGGVGSFAIQLSKHLGATVAATASDVNQQLLTELGADLAIDYRAQDFTEVIRDYDAVLDTQAGKTLFRSFEVVKAGGWVVTIAHLPDPDTAKEMGLPLPARLALRFMTRKVRKKARQRGVHYRFVSVRADKRQLAEIAALLDQGVIKPVIDSTYTFETIGDAFRKQESGHARGKVVVQLQE